MKKSLIALAVMAAAGAASAQSSVTLFGIVDATLAWGRGNVADKFQLTNSGYNSSRLGFRGTEDLGGGMSASFWLEAGLTNDNGTGASSNSNNATSGSPTSAGNPSGNGAVANGSQGLTFNRRSTVSLAGNWGELRLGRDYTPNFWNLTVFDPFGTNGVGTNQMLNGVSLGINPFLGTAAAAANPGGFYPTQVRASNSIGYFLPRNMGGFYGQLQYFTGETASNAVNDGEGDGYGARFGYAAGPFNIAIAYGQVDIAPTAGTPAVTFAGDIRTWNIGAQWDFGFMKLMGQYGSDQLEISTANVDGEGWLLGALVPVGAGEIRVAYSEYMLDSSLAVFGGNEPKTQKLAVGYVHNLSKRTALYTTYAYVRNRDGAGSALNGATVNLNSSSSGLDLGIRHSF